MQTKILAALREPVQLVLKLVGIPLLCLTPLFFIALYLLGGTDLLRFTLNQLTWKFSFKILGAVVLLGFVTSIRHLFWYGDEPPPLWWRRSVWVNLVEIIVLLGLVLLAIWAIPRFA